MYALSQQLKRYNFANIFSMLIQWFHQPVVFDCSSLCKSMQLNCCNCILPMSSQVTVSHLSNYSTFWLILWFTQPLIHKEFIPNTLQRDEQIATKCLYCMGSQKIQGEQTCPISYFWFQKSCASLHSWGKSAWPGKQHWLSFRWEEKLVKAGCALNTWAEL